MEPRPSPRCRECLRDLKTVAPRNVVRITTSAKLPAVKMVWKLLGLYCSADCALNAIQRGWPQTLTRKP
jgi:hypothetical protein